jgi:hypothetical protein
LLKYELARFTSGRFVEEQADQGEVQESGGRLKVVVREVQDEKGTTARWMCHKRTRHTFWTTYGSHSDFN